MPSNKINKLIPSIKKDLKSFMLEEKGGASKQALISFGALLTSIEVVGFLSNIVSGSTISAKHDHCDPAHSSVGSSTQHASADGVPESHCSAHDNSSGWAHGSTANPAHKNFVYLTYG